MSGTTSQPNLNSIVAALAHTERDTGLELRRAEPLFRLLGDSARRTMRRLTKRPKSGSADVYIHEMPGGQYTNLKAQAEAMGLGGRWPEVARMYADVNMAFGDIVKVTPSSKVVGDMALYLLSHDLKLESLENPTPGHPLTVPNSVVDMFIGSLGQPEGGWPPKLQNAVLHGKKTG